VSEKIPLFIANFVRRTRAQILALAIFPSDDREQFQPL
jgi:hypothetical protein